MSTAITLVQAEAKLSALLAASASDTLSVRFADRSVTYRNATELIDQINYWTRMVTQLRREAAGASRHGYAVADFQRKV